MPRLLFAFLFPHLLPGLSSRLVSTSLICYHSGSCAGALSVVDSLSRSSAADKWKSTIATHTPQPLELDSGD